MPYIKNEDREKFFSKQHANEHLAEIIGELCDNAGDLNYVFTMIAHTYIRNKGQRYQNYNDIVGALEGCKLELYRRFIGKYEDEKIIENGDVDGITND
jgi:hypothetical protein